MATRKEIWAQAAYERQTKDKQEKRVECRRCHCMVPTFIIRASGYCDPCERKVAVAVEFGDEW